MNARFEKTLVFFVRSGVFLVLLVPLIVTPSTLFPYVVGKAIYFRALIEITFACWLILSMRNPSYRVPRSWVLTLFAVFVFVSLLAALAGVSFQRSFWGDYRRMGGVFDLAHWFAFVVVLASVLKNASHWSWLWNVNLAVSLLVAFLGLTQLYDIRVFEKVFGYLQPTGRVDITFGNPTYVGAYMLVNFLVALAFLAHSFEQHTQAVHQTSPRQRHRRAPEGNRSSPVLLWRAFWTITAALDLWVLTLSGTRGAVAGLATALLVAGAAYLAWGARRHLRLLSVAAIAAMLLIAVVVLLTKDTAAIQKIAQSNILAERILNGVTEGLRESSIKSRLIATDVGSRAFLHAPILGWGPENFAVAFDQYADPEDFISGTQVIDQAHNKPLEVLSTTGVVGLFSYALLIGMVLWAVARTVQRKSEDQLLSLLMGAAVIAYLVQDLFLFDTPGTVLQFMLLLGWVAGKEVRLQGEPVPLPLGRQARRRTARGPQHLVADKDASSDPSDAKGPIDRLLDRVQRDGENLAESFIVASAIILVLMIAVLYFFSFRPYRAAQIFPVQATTIERYFADARRSFDVFPPLATLGRQILFDTIYDNWAVVAKGSEPVILEQLRAQGEKAIQSEPQNARLYLGIARVYQRAAMDAPAYVPAAESYILRAKSLAPAAPEIVERLKTQEVLAILAKQAEAPATGCRGCVLWLTLEEGGGWSVVKDYSGFENHGVKVGAGWANRRSDTALRFDGREEYIDFGSRNSLDQDFARLTLTGWVYAESGQEADAGLIGKGSHSYGLTLSGAVPTLHFYIGGDDSNYVQVDYKPYLRGWHHIAGVFDGMSLRLYIDGQLVASRTSRFKSTGGNGTFAIGRATTYYEGLIGSVRIYSRAISADEIASIYASR